MRTPLLHVQRTLQLHCNTHCNYNSLEHTAVRCNTLQHATLVRHVYVSVRYICDVCELHLCTCNAHCNYTATHTATHTATATHCNTLQHATLVRFVSYMCLCGVHVTYANPTFAHATHAASTLQHTLQVHCNAQCNTLQHTLQHAATHMESHFYTGNALCNHTATTLQHTLQHTCDV